MFLEVNSDFQDISYIHIWFKIANECLKRGNRIKVPYIEFTPATKGRIPINTKMSFFDSFNSNLIHNDNSDYTDYQEIDVDTDEEINTSAYHFKELTI